MNQKQLETAVRSIQNDSALDFERKAYLTQNIMASRYIVEQQNRVTELQQDRPVLSGMLPTTYHDPATKTLGCAHYRRK